MKKIVLTSVAMAVAAFSANAADFKAQTLRLAHTAATSHAHHEASLLFAKEVADKTGGKVKVEVYGAGELGGRVHAVGSEPGGAERLVAGRPDRLCAHHGAGRAHHGRVGAGGSV